MHSHSFETNSKVVHLITLWMHTEQKIQSTGTYKFGIEFNSKFHTYFHTNAITFNGNLQTWKPRRNKRRNFRIDIVVVGVFMVVSIVQVWNSKPTTRITLSILYGIQTMNEKVNKKWIHYLFGIRILQKEKKNTNRTNR